MFLLFHITVNQRLTSGKSACISFPMPNLQAFSYKTSGKIKHLVSGKLKTHQHSSCSIERICTESAFLADPLGHKVYSAWSILTNYSSITGIERMFLKEVCIPKDLEFSSMPTLLLCDFPPGLSIFYFKN